MSHVRLSDRVGPAPCVGSIVVAGATKVCAREHSILSPIIREAWDTDRLQTVTKKASDSATGVHVAIVGNITATEYRRQMTETDNYSGFTNRFIHVCAQRSKLLPAGGEVPAAELDRLANEIGQRIALAKDVRKMYRTPAAEQLWERIYLAGESEEGDGLFAAVTARRSPQMLRLAVGYSLLDGCAEMQPPHVVAALAAWVYGEESAAYLFGRETTTDPVANKLLAALDAAGDDGIDLEEQHRLFGRNVPAARLAAVRAELEMASLAATTPTKTGGRTRWVTRRVATKETKLTKKAPLRVLLDELAPLTSFPSSTSYSGGGAA